VKNEHFWGKCVRFFSILGEYFAHFFAPFGWFFSRKLQEVLDADFANFAVVQSGRKSPPHGMAGKNFF